MLSQRISFYDFVTQKFRIQHHKDVLAKLNTPEFECYVQEAFENGLTSLDCSNFCETFIFTQTGEKVQSLKEFTRADVATHFLVRNHKYAKDPSTFVFYIRDRYPFLLQHPCFTPPILCHAINSTKRLIDISQLKYPNETKKNAVKYFLDDNPDFFLDLSHYASSLEDDADSDHRTTVSTSGFNALASVLKNFSLNLVYIVKEYTFGSYTPLIDGRMTTPVYFINHYLTDSWLFSPYAESKMGDAVEVSYEPACDELIGPNVHIQKKAALLFIFNNLFPHHSTYTVRLKYLAKEKQLQYKEITIPSSSDTYLSAALTREKMDTKDHIQVIKTESSTNVYLQTARGMRLGTILAASLGLLAPKSIQLGGKIVRNLETKTTSLMPAKELQDKCKLLKECADQIAVLPQARRSKKLATKMVEDLNQTNLTRARLDVIAQTWIENLSREESEDPKMVGAINALRSGRR